MTPAFRRARRLTAWWRVRSRRLWSIVVERFNALGLSENAILLAFRLAGTHGSAS